MKKTLPSYAAEFFGTFILTFIGAAAICINRWSGEPGLLGIAIAHGLALSIVVTATMKISGAHINPAVSIALWTRGRIKGKEALSYIVSQLAGASLAGVLLCTIFSGIMVNSGAGDISVVAAAKLGTPSFDPTILSPMKAVLVEILLTFILVFAIYGTAIDGRSPSVAGFGIGLAVTFDILAGGPLTGAAMNPARVFGTLVAGGSGTASLLSQHWVYWVGPIAGAILSAWVYEKLILGKN